MATDEEKVAKQQESVLKEGYYSAHESDDNSVATSEPYAGVSPEYQNFANETDRPLISEDKDLAKLENAQAEHSRAMAAPDEAPVHPTKATQPTNPTFQQERHSPLASRSKPTASSKD